MDGSRREFLKQGGGGAGAGASLGRAEAHEVNHARR